MWCWQLFPWPRIICSCSNIMMSIPQRLASDYKGTHGTFVSSAPSCDLMCDSSYCLVVMHCFKYVFAYDWLYCCELNVDAVVNSVLRSTDGSGQSSNHSTGKWLGPPCKSFGSCMRCVLVSRLHQVLPNKLLSSVAMWKAWEVPVKRPWSWNSTSFTQRIHIGLKRVQKCCMVMW